MSNKLIIAAAGSGKTTHLVKEALKITESRVLITTFTEANELEIRKKIFEINHFIPENITIQSWFSFLIQHGVKPYQSVIFEGKINGLLLVNGKSGLRYRLKNGVPVYYGEENPEKHYFSDSRLIYSDKLSKFVVRANELTHGLVIKRIGKIYSHLFIDEVQDLAGYDLEILKQLFSLDTSIMMVGDPRQVTYHTHDEAKYKKYVDGNIVEFINNECSNGSVEIDDITLNKTFRNNEMICSFANAIYNEFRPCECAMHYFSGHDGVFFVSPADVNDYLSIYRPVQLRDSAKTPVNSEYPVMNLGDSKGLTFERVLIYPTSKMTDWIIDHSKELKTKSRSKFYVGVTRAKYSVAIVFENKKNITVPGINTYTKSVTTQ